MGQTIDKENSFRSAIINGLISCKVKFTNGSNPYQGVNYGLIIKPLNLDYNFREPIRYFFKGYPYHVGIIRATKSTVSIYSFCPDLQEPHRGTLKKDIIVETIDAWSNYEIFWFIDKPEEFLYQKIEARLMDLMQLKFGLIELEEYNRRHNTTLKMSYNLISNNCTDVALSVLIGQTRCFQIESIVPIIIQISKMKQIMDMVPEYGKIWLQDFKYLNTIKV